MEEEIKRLLGESGNSHLLGILAVVFAIILTLGMSRVSVVIGYNVH